MNTLILLCILLILSLDFYIKHKKIILKILKRTPTGEFRIDKKGYGDKVKEESRRESANFITKR